MKPIVTPRSNMVFKLEGGSEENDLPVEQAYDDDENSVLVSTWELTDDERKRISEGANVELMIWGKGLPPVALAVEEEDTGDEADN